MIQKHISRCLWADADVSFFTSESVSEGHPDKVEQLKLKI
jgi:hypothetical protein